VEKKLPSKEEYYCGTICMLFIDLIIGITVCSTVSVDTRLENQEAWKVREYVGPGTCNHARAHVYLTSNFAHLTF